MKIRSIIWGVMLLTIIPICAATDTWQSDPNIVSGLGGIGDCSTPTVFQKDSTWYLIAGVHDGVFYGYNWTGSTWQSDPNIVSGLGDIGYRSSPTVFQKDDMWYLISGDTGGVFYGYNWTGYTWQSDPNIVSGIGDIGSASTPTVFQKDGTWHLISGEFDGVFNGYNWTGSTWQSDPNIVSGIGDVGAWSAPTVFQKDDMWYLIAGEEGGVFYGYNWTGYTWQSDPNIVSGLGDVGYHSTPTVFQKDGAWHLISGEDDEVFNGYYMGTLSPINLAYTKSRFWVNHTWSAGTGYDTDSYNVSINGTWHNDTTTTYYNNTLSTYGDWSNITVYGYNTTYGLSASYASEDVQLPYLVPAVPTGAGSTWDYYWVNHTWTEGSSYGIWCGETDSYNVSINGIWHNGTTNTYYNNTGLPLHGWSNASIYAFNTTGEINETYIYQHVQMENRNITITNTSDWAGWEGVTVYVDYDATDPDGDTPIFSCNRTDLFTDFNATTGQGNWTPPTNGTWYIDFGVSDGCGSNDNFTMEIVTHATTPANATNLTNTTGWYWVNHTWQCGSGALAPDSYNVSINGTWHNGTTNTYYNNTGLTEWGQWSNVTVLSYSTATGKLSKGSISDNVRLMPTLVPYNNFTSNSLQAFSSFEKDFTVEFSCTSNVNVKTWTWYNVDTSSGTSDSVETNATKYIDSWGIGTVTVKAASDYGEVNMTWTYDIILPDDWFDPNYGQSIPISVYSGCDGDVFHYYVKIEHVDTNSCKFADCRDLFFYDPRYGGYIATLPFYTANVDGLVHRTTDETVYVRMQWLTGGAQMIYMYSGCADSDKLRDNQFGGRAQIPGDSFKKEFCCIPPCDDSTDLYVTPSSAGVKASLVIQVNESGSCGWSKYLTGNIDDVVDWSCSDVCRTRGLYIYPTRRGAGTACSAYDRDALLIQPYGGASVGVYINAMQSLWSSGDRCWVSIGGHATDIPSSGTKTDSFSIDPGYNGGFATRAGVYSDWSSMCASGSATIHELYYEISQDPNPCRAETFFGEEIYEPVPVIVTYDEKGNTVYGLNYMIYDKDHNNVYTSWTQDDDGVVYLNDPMYRNILFIARTCDGQFVHDFTLTSEAVVNTTIPITYNLDIYTYDKDTGAGVKDSLCALYEYSATDPKSFWGSDYASAMCVPIVGCLSVPYCDILVERWGYSTYNATEVDWTGKSTMIRDYRHNALLTKD